MSTANGAVETKRDAAPAQPGQTRNLSAFSFVLAAVLGAFYFPYLSGLKTPFVSDHTYYFEPFAKYIGKALVNGQLPLWNPNLYCGMSQLAVPSPGIFYPLTFLFGIMQYAQALSLSMLINQLAAGIGGFLLIECCGWGVAAATVCGIGMALSGYMFSLATNQTIVAGAAWIPLLFWGLRKIKLALQADLPVYFASFMAALAAFMIVIAGRPEIFAPALGLALLYCMFEAWRLPAGRVQQLVWQCGSIGAGVLLCMPMLLPVLEWLTQSPRAHGLNFSQSMMWSANWYDLLGVVTAQPFGDLQVLGAAHLKLVATRPVYQPYVQSCYLGPVFITAAIWGFADRTWKWRYLFLILFAGILVLCLGEFTPVMPKLLETINALTMFRYPIKWMFFILVILVIAAARGTMRFSEGTVSPVGRWTAVVLWQILLLVASFFLFMFVQKRVLSFSHPPLSVDAQFCLGRAMLYSTVAGAVTCLVEYFAATGKLKRNHAVTLLIAGAAVSIMVPAIYFFPLSTKPTFYSSKQEMSSWLKVAEEDSGRMGSRATSKSKSVPSESAPSQSTQAVNSSADSTGTTAAEPIGKGHADRDVGGTKGRFLALYFDPLWCPDDFKAPDDERWTPAFFSYARNLLLPNTNLDADVAEAGGYEAGETGPYRNLFLDILHKSSICLPTGKRPTDRPSKYDNISDSPLLRFCQCTHTMWVGTQTFKQRDIPLLDPRFFRLVKEDEETNMRLFQNLHPLPRAYLSQYWMWCDNQSQIFDRIKSVRPEAFNPAAYTMVEKGITSGISDRRGTNKFLGPLIYPPPEKSPEIPEAVFHSDYTQRDPLVAAQPVSILVDEPTHLSLSVNCDRFCFLVSEFIFYPGWQVSIDGAMRQIYRANTESRAVYMTPGSHLIEFNYVPDSLRFGFYYAAAGALAMLIVLYCALHPHIMKLLRSVSS